MTILSLQLNIFGPISPFFKIFSRHKSFKFEEFLICLNTFFICLSNRCLLITSCTYLRHIFIERNVKNDGKSTLVKFSSLSGRFGPASWSAPTRQLKTFKAREFSCRNWTRSTPETSTASPTRTSQKWTRSSLPSETKTSWGTGTPTASRTSTSAGQHNFFGEIFFGKILSFFELATE